MRKKNIVVIFTIVWVIVWGTLLNVIFGEKDYVSPYPDFDLLNSQIEEFNSTFSNYQGMQPDSQVIALLKRLVVNANTYKEKTVLIPIVSYNSNGNFDDININNDKTYCEVTEEGNISDYLYYLNEILENLSPKHVYSIVFSYANEGFVKGITINYDKDSRKENFEIDKKTQKLVTIDGISLYISESNENNLEDNKDK